MSVRTLTLTITALAALTSGCSIHVHGAAGRANSYDHHYSARIGTSPSAPQWRPVSAQPNSAQPTNQEPTGARPASPAPRESAVPGSVADSSSPSDHATVLTGRRTPNAPQPGIADPRIGLRRPTEAVSPARTSSHTTSSAGSVSRAERSPQGANLGHQLQPTRGDGQASSTRASGLRQSPRVALTRATASSKNSQRGLPRDRRAAQRVNPPRAAQGAQPAGPRDSE